MAEYKFKEYKDESFRDFVRAMSDLYKMGQIRFYPHQGKGLFGAFQLRHISPGWDIQHPKGFIYVWAQHRDVVKTVTFEMFHPSGSPKIKMTIDLKRKLFVLDQTTDITTEEVVSILRRYFSIKDVTLLNKTREIVATTFVSIGSIVAMFLVFFGLNWFLNKLPENSEIVSEPNIAERLVEKMFTSDANNTNVANESKTADANQQSNNLTNLPAEDVQNHQTEDASTSRVVWWKDTWWGFVATTVVAGIIIAFIVYMLGWNAN